MKDRMVNIFQIAVERLVEVGFYNFLLPFILFTTVLYAVLKKTQILGDSAVIHGIVSVTAGLFIFGVPVILGTSLLQPLTTFLTQATLAILVFVVGFLIASFFYPNIMEKIPEIFKPPGPGGWLVWTVVGLSAIVGMFAFVFGPIRNAIRNSGLPGDLVTLTIALAVIFIILLIVANSLGREVK